MADVDLLASSLPSNSDVLNMHVSSWTKTYEAEEGAACCDMPDGTRNVGHAVLQLVDANLWDDIANGEAALCDALNKIQPANGEGLADNYDFVFFMAAGATTSYKSFHLNVHQDAIAGTGTPKSDLANCGSSGMKGATVLEALTSREYGPFFLQFMQQQAVHMGALDSELTSFWGWTTFSDRRGLLGGFDWFHCPDGYSPRLWTACCI
jgi:hypothetical protein